MGLYPQNNDMELLPPMKEKLLLAQELLQTIKERNALSEEECSFIKDILEEQCTIIKILKEENFIMKEKAPHMEPLHKDVVQFKKDASDALLGLELRLSDTGLQLVGLEKRLTQLGLDVVVEQSAHTRELDQLNNQWRDKLQCTQNHTKDIIKEVVKKHCEAKKGYEKAICGLKEQIAHKEAEVAWCQLMISERDVNIDKEMVNLKKELEVSTMKNQELLQQRLVEVERRANKMTRKCLKLQQDYENKISNLKKEKDLQVQTLQKFVGLQNVAEKESGWKDNKLMDAVKQLEARYRKIIIGLHAAAQEQRIQDMKRIAALESVITPEPSKSLP